MWVSDRIPNEADHNNRDPEWRWFKFSNRCWTWGKFLSLTYIASCAYAARYLLFKDGLQVNSNIDEEYLEAASTAYVQCKCQMLSVFYFLMCTLWLASGAADSEKVFGPHLPDIYIKIIPHPHSTNPDLTIISLTTQNDNTGSPFAYVPTPECRPWAPFRTLADFEYTETAVKGLLSEDLVNRQLVGFNEAWSIGGSRLTFHSHKDMQKSLAVARDYGIQVGVV